MFRLRQVSRTVGEWNEALAGREQAVLPEALLGSAIAEPNETAVESSAVGGKRKIDDRKTNATEIAVDAKEVIASEIVKVRSLMIDDIPKLPFNLLSTHNFEVVLLVNVH